MKKYAFFDVDNTIYSGYTASDFIFYGIEKGNISLAIKHELEDAFKKYAVREIDYNEVSQICLDLFSRSMKGWSVSRGEKEITNMLKDKEKLFNEWVFPVIDFLKDEKFQIVLVSAGPEPVIQALNERINADRVLTTKIELKEGKYTGKSTFLLNGSYKVKKIKEIIRRDKKVYIIGFGDSPGDFDMLSLMDKAFVVKNDHHSEMIKVAKEKGWILFGNDEEVIEELKNKPRILHYRKNHYT